MIKDYVSKRKEEKGREVIDLLSQNWLKPPSSDGKEKNPYQFL